MKSMKYQAVRFFDRLFYKTYRKYKNMTAITESADLEAAD